MTIIKSQGPIPKRSAYHRRVVDSNKTPAAKVRFAAIAKQPCALYVNWGNECNGRTTVAHQDGAGMALKSPYDKTFACCEGHHLLGPNSIAHMGVRAWERKYGPQSKWIEITNYRMKE